MPPVPELLHFREFKSVSYTETNLNSEVPLPLKNPRRCVATLLNPPLVANERANARTQTPICWLTLLNGCLNTFAALARSLIQHFPHSPFFIPIIGSCMLVESLSAPYDSLNGGEGERRRRGGGCCLVNH